MAGYGNQWSSGLYMFGNLHQYKLTWFVWEMCASAFWICADFVAIVLLLLMIVLAYDKTNMANKWHLLLAKYYCQVDEERAHTDWNV